MENIWQNLLAPEVTVCGRRLTTFTLWHHALLRAFQCPLFDADPKMNARDLLAAVEICRTTWPKRPRFPRRRRWARKLRNRATLEQRAEWFAEWLAAHMVGPQFWSEKGQTSTLTAPDVLLLVYGLTSKAGLSQAEAWNTSPGVAETILGTVAELEGAELSFADPEELVPENAPYQPSTREEVFERALRDLGRRRAEEFIEGWDRQQCDN